MLYVGSFCVDTSSPEGFLRSSDCDKLNNYICEIDENTAFAIVKGKTINNVIYKIYHQWLRSHFILNLVTEHF